MSYAKLRGRIKEIFGTQEAFAAAMEMDKSTLSLKLNGRYEFNRLEIEKACEALQIPFDEIGAYFFTAKVGIYQQ